MNPTPEQIAVAAYHRWQRRGGEHGWHDEDWDAAEKDLTFGMNYRWAVRHALRPAPGGDAGPVLLGQAQAEAGGKPRRCRYCERGEPATSFRLRPWALPPLLGNTALVAWDECDDCRAAFDAHLAAPFEAFAAPLLGDSPAPPDTHPGIPVPALKALVRMALAVLPAEEMHHFDDTVEWVSNPDPGRDAALLDGLGCRVYFTPAPVPSPFASLARRFDDDERVPYMLFFLGTDRVVFQTHLPFCPRDEDLDDEPGLLRGPALSMSLGAGPAHRASRAVFLPLTAAEPGAAPARPAGRDQPRAAAVGR